MVVNKKPDPYFRSIKVPMNYILKHPKINQSKIFRAVTTANKIVIHGLQFLKLYLLDYYQQHQKLPKVDKTLINCCLKNVCQRNDNVGRRPKAEIQQLKTQLNKLYQSHYQNLQLDTLHYTHLNTVLDYLTVDILTIYENNVKFNYINYVERYVNVVWQKNRLFTLINKFNLTKKARDKAKYKLCSELRKIKNDLLNNTRTSKSNYHQWITDKIKTIRPNKSKFDKDNIYYDVKSNPQDYLTPMLFMMQEIESYQVKLHNVFPQRSEIIPKHIRLDTTTLVQLLLQPKHGNKADFLFKGNLKRREDEIWRFFFRIERKCFRQKNYSFHHMIETDGVSVSILLIRKDLAGKKFRVGESNENTDQYIDTVTENLQGKNIVGVDPGKNSILYCVDGDTKDANILDYRKTQRQKECRSKRYGRLVLQLKKDNLFGSQTVTEIETELSLFNRKTLKISNYLQYLTKKNQINQKLGAFYQTRIFRKLKLNSYTNTKKHEQKLINRFRNKFGAPKDTIVCIGDWEQRKHMKHKDPTKGIGMRTVLRKAGYNVYLVDEHKTSCRCCKCGGKTAKFMQRKNHKGNLVLVHALLRCQNGCGVWNRDCNGATNIYKIAKNAIDKVSRPGHLLRTKSKVKIKISVKLKQLNGSLPS